MFQCKNCNKFFKTVQQLRRHYLFHLPYYFGQFICIKCELRFQSKLSLLQHCFTVDHQKQSGHNCDIFTKRLTYLDNCASYSQVFTQQEKDFLLNQSCSSNFDYTDIVAKLEHIFTKDTQNMENISSPATVNLADEDNEMYMVTANTLSGVNNSTVPAPPNLRGCTPTMDERSNCCCEKLLDLERKLDNQHRSQEAKLNSVMSTLLKANQSALEYVHSLAQTFVSGQAETRNLAEQIKNYNLAVAEATRKSFGQ